MNEGAERVCNMQGRSYFKPELFEFLRELKSNNNKVWFQANKAMYEHDVKGPMLRFIADFGDRLSAISKHFTADPQPVGGSMFRIYRDTRFSHDKSPYKTAAAAHFPHNNCGKDVHAPGFYLHLEPGDCFGGGGLWHPNGPTLKMVRDSIVSHPREWKKVLGSGIEIEGDALKRPPQGYKPEHPFISDIKRKDFYTMRTFSEADVCSPDFMDLYLEACQTVAPLVAFLTKAVGLSW